MKKWIFMASFCLLALVLLLPVSVQAEQSNANANEDEIQSDLGPADDWFARPKDSPRGKNKSKKDNKSADEKERYVFLMNDNGYDYYLDKQSARWINIPYSENEEILDVWIRLAKVNDEEYSYPQKYFMEHYYLRPKKQQVQFLSELEVTGRPNNAIREREYSVRNWENLVSGSLEDEIYHGVLKEVKKNSSFWPKHKTFHDAMEDVFRISY
ncbi:hypothetical protein SAMN05216582_10367 [Selenomonas ruminantium]|uniref:Uncharacterized protein n=1 Tax=Selenomonas ruminantium TaxID=971 RepID=A0A1M6S2H4_SELRU|nr:hypothetical protein [Selenomonas ruminantium]SHK38688.1 hypothetical protein SAMN05216582_10367 [Selenomonas ruminantium]